MNREKRFTNEVQCFETKKKQTLSKMHVADVRYHFDCFLGETVKYKPAGLVQL